MVNWLDMDEGYSKWKQAKEVLTQRIQQDPDDPGNAALLTGFLCGFPGPQDVVGSVRADPKEALRHIFKALESFVKSNNQSGVNIASSYVETIRWVIAQEGRLEAANGFLLEIDRMFDEHRRPWKEQQQREALARERRRAEQEAEASKPTADGLKSEQSRLQETAEPPASHNVKPA
jgi:hypothetical protein